MGNFIDTLLAWMNNTHLPQQIKDVDYMGLFTNPWFLVPFLGLLGYLLYKQAFKDLIIVLLFVAVWFVSGMDYMQTLVVDGEVQVSKILPVIYGGAVTLAFVIYMLFGGSD